MIETKKNRKTVRDIRPKKMLNMSLQNDVLKTWEESFIDGEHRRNSKH